MKAKAIWQKLVATGRNDTDDELMEQIKKGNHSAFKIIFERHGGRLLGYAQRLMGSRSRAEDLTQEVWMKVIRNADSYQGQGSFVAWLYTITRNAAFSQLRKNKDWEVLEEHIEETAFQEEDFSKRIEQQGDIDYLKTLIDQLPSAQRAVIVMSLADEHSYEEMAEELGTTVSAIKSLLFRARKGLQSMWERER